MHFHLPPSVQRITTWINWQKFRREYLNSRGVFQNQKFDFNLPGAYENLYTGNPVLTRIRLTTGKIVDEPLGDLGGRMDVNRPADKRTFNEERQAAVTRSALLTADVRGFFYDLMGIFVELELPVVRHSLSSWTDNIKLKTRKSSCVNARGIPPAV